MDLDKNYRLGTIFDLKIAASSGHVRVFYNDSQKLDWFIARRGCYFKAGCYTQSNTKKGDDPTTTAKFYIRRLKIAQTIAE